MLTRTPEEQLENWLWADTQSATEKECRDLSVGDDPVSDMLANRPCAFVAGQVDDYFRYLERGLLHTHIASSDSHGGLVEPGFPRTYFRTEAGSPGALPIADAVKSLRGGHAFATYGPFVRAHVDDKSFGDTASVGARVDLSLNIQTASWFGVDRVEIYMNGLIAEVLEPDSPPETIEDVKRIISLDVPDRDSWIVIIAMGLKPENSMAPVTLDSPFGDVQLAVVASNAFSQLPIISGVFPLNPTAPDWAPTFPYVITNPIYLDRDGNGHYDPPLRRPEFCSVPCGDDSDCPFGQQCLEPEKQCGPEDIVGRECNRRVASMHQ
jgi:hypothetical protein